MIEEYIGTLHEQQKEVGLLTEGLDVRGFEPRAFRNYLGNAKRKSYP